MSRSRITTSGPLLIGLALVFAGGACQAAGTPPPSSPPAASPTTSGAAFACPPLMLALTAPSNRLTGVSVTGETGFDRVAIQFGPSGIGSGATPGLIASSVTPPFVEGASGLPLSVGGDRFLDLTFRDMIVADDGGTPTLSGPARLTADGSAVVEAVQAEAFEGVVRWIIGVREPGCGRVTVDAPGSRILVDLQAP